MKFYFNKRVTRVTSLVLVLSILLQVSFPLTVYALTGGPSQPEVQSFEPVGTSEMVDLFSGDFNYNIPLLDVGGYPINISYHSGISTDQEASWVGLGWNINPGVINRNMRGIPDDFSGEKITKNFNMKGNKTIGLSAVFGSELIGADKEVAKRAKEALKESKLGKLSFGLGLKYNNYNGIGFDISMSPGVSSGDGNKGTLTAGLGLSASNDGGVGVSPSVGFSMREEKTVGSETHSTSSSLSVGLPFNSRQGFTSLSISADHSKSVSADIKNSKGEVTAHTNSRTAGANGGTSISFAGLSYVPQSKLPLFNLSLSLSATIGLATYGIHGNVRTKGYFSGQFLLDNQKSQSSYGYMYTHNGANDTRGLLDYNRERDAGYSKYAPNLPLTNFTYDVYSVSGQGIGGVYRPFRNDVGVLFDSEVRNFTVGIDYPGIEIGGGAIVHAGMDFSVNESDAYTGKWEDDNDFASNVKFGTNDNFLYEPYYFKQAGEKTTDENIAHFNNFGGYDPVRVELLKASRTKALNSISNHNGTVKAIDGNTKRENKAKRNEAITFLYAQEAKKFAVDKQILAYNFNDKSANRKNNALALNRTNIPAHHISEVSSYRTDGARYVYGIPAYNYTQREVSFSVDRNADQVNTEGLGDGLVSYISANNLSAYPGGHIENSVDNKSGIDHFFDETIIPDYAHSYLLTSVLSPDYVDQTGDGPTEDDLGTYTKINYSVLRNGSNVTRYKWRTPYNSNRANFNEGLKSDDGDNKASYMYGEKEMWFMHSIESKDYIAFFVTSDRDDALESAGLDGGKGTATSKKLDKIILYAKKDLEQNPLESAHPAVPIKTVHFDYADPSDELCKGISNLKNGSSHQGKLTLQRIYFTYGNSFKAKQRGYVFSYAKGTGNNYRYNPKDYDRWGNYKPNKITNPNSEFPYAEQDKILADKYASAWSLNEIELPSGGIIKINYEADDYAFVQDRRAMQMMKVIGSSKEGPESITAGPSGLSNNLYESGIFENGGVGKAPYQYIYFKLSSPIFSVGELKSKYFSEQNGKLMKYLYYKFLTKIKDDDTKYEFVPGYIPTKDIEFGLCSGEAWQNEGGHDELVEETHSDYAWIKLKPIPMADIVPVGNANPISHSAWNFIKLNLPKVAYNDDGNKYDNPSLRSVFTALLSTVNQITQLVTGFYFDMRRRNIAQSFDKEKSFVRLFNPDGAKIGGGVRVKSIVTNDAFEKLTGGASSLYDDSEYGQEYSYRTKDQYGKEISSGVASYEPLIGGEENPFRQPIFSKEFKFFIPSESHMQEEPFGEGFFPSASVGYSSVSVKSIRSGSSNTFTGTGKVVHEFYTTRDFPTIVRQTTTQAIRDKPFPLLNFIKLLSRDDMTVSQGYCIELNDMNGKPKGQKVYAEGDNDHPISSIEHKYKTDPGNPKHLSNKVLTMDKSGAATESDLVGVDYDIVVDMREQTTKSRSGGLGGNLEAFIALFPFAIPMIWPSYSQETVCFRSSVITKVINRYGILESTTAKDLTSTVTTSNMLYDKLTGEVLLTKTMNQYEDPVYAMTYPAHLAYSGMGPAYLNAGNTVSVDEAVTNPSTYFVEGDELSVGNELGWVFQVLPKLIVMDKNGETMDLLDLQNDGVLSMVKIIRSGRKNQQTIPMSKFTSLTNPLQDIGSQTYRIVTEKIIHADATIFTQESGLFCECSLQQNPVNGSYPAYNPYLKGQKGYWKVKRNYLKLSDRTQTRFNGNLAVRKDGIYTHYNPFYKPNNGYEWLMDTTGWVYTSEVTLFSPYGYELETRDPLYRYSSSVYGYNYKLPILVAANAQYKEVGFDGFEDYDYYSPCQSQHFGYKQALNEVASVSPQFSHSGKRSIKLEGRGTSVKLRRVIVPCPNKN